MASDFTQAQGSEDQRRASELSLRKGRPPCEVPGYEPRRFLGSGAYGEVWVAIDRTTGRQVAIKFYLHRGGLDWSFLSHEVEKLAFLSADRYVVQLLDVGWESQPPYYVMEYIEHGSLDDLLATEGSLPPAQAVELFREIVVGLLHAHGKGVLHCDLKPANILLDQDGKPRLADFGQSRLSHEQTPALGTLFYMAPEQADMAAIPDARWDVYALGAILYAMLTGNPPHRDAQAVTEIEQAPNLSERLSRYRKLISTSAAPTGHRKISGVDKRLAEIVERCLAADPRQRYANVQAVLDALDARAAHRSRLPLVVLGAVGPVLLLSVMSVLAWLWFNTSLKQSNVELVTRDLQALRFAARGLATGTGKELEVRFRDVELVASDERLVNLMSALESNPETRDMLATLSAPKRDKKKYNEALDQFLRSEAAAAVQRRLEKLVGPKLPEGINSWFITDARGLQIARFPESPTRGLNYAWRTYFHGELVDRPEDWRPEPDDHLQETRLSAVYRSRSTNRWVVAVSTPVFAHKSDGERTFLGVVAMSFQIGQQFIQLPEGSNQFAMLIDVREGERPGIVLQHPLFNELQAKSGILPERLEDYRILLPSLPPKEGDPDFVDPLASDPEGEKFRQRFLAARAYVYVRDVEAGWVVIVEDSYDRNIGTTLDQLRSSFVRSGLVGLVAIALVIVGLWSLVIRTLDKPPRWNPSPPAVDRQMAETLPIGRGTNT